MRVATYQAPLLPIGSLEAVELIRKQIQVCEERGVRILCCPEGILGGLADYADNPKQIAVDVRSGQLEEVLSPISTKSVCVIVGFTELGDSDALYNSAAVIHRGAIAGVFRKLYPAINQSVYTAGSQLPVFTVD